MIVRRSGSGSRRNLPRMIVRRTRPAVGARRPRTIVRRPPVGVVEEPERRIAWARLLLGAAAIVAGVAAGLGGWWVWESPLLEISHIEVVGAQQLPPETIAARSGLLGDRIVTADLSAAQDRIMAHPLVRSARLERRWPNRIRIVVDERQPWGAWEQAGYRYVIDREGVVLGTGDPPPGGIVIRSSASRPLRAGDRVDRHAVDAAAQLQELLPSRLGVAVAEVTFDVGAGVVVRTADGREAYIGDASGIEYKLAVWAAVAAEAAERGLDYRTVDLRFGDRPVLRQ